MEQDDLLAILTALLKSQPKSAPKLENEITVHMLDMFTRHEVT